MTIYVYTHTLFIIKLYNDAIISINPFFRKFCNTTSFTNQFYYSDTLRSLALRSQKINVLFGNINKILAIIIFEIHVNQTLLLSQNL
jgi:hypothetical protein